MTQRQRENIAKYLYDLSKILFATAVVGNLVAWSRMNVIILAVGSIACLSLVWCGYKLDGVKP